MVVFEMALAIPLNHQVQEVLAVLGECQILVSWTIQAPEDLDSKAGHYVIPPFNEREQHQAYIHMQEVSLLILPMSRASQRMHLRRGPVLLCTAWLVMNVTV